MKSKIFRAILFSLLATVTIAPGVAFAHQPRITEGRRTDVIDPEVSKAYYGKLAGEPDVYLIEADQAFDLYVGVLVPDIAGQKRDVSATVLRDGVQIAALDGMTFAWTRFFEPFGHDTYWQGPEYQARVEAGSYEIRVSSGSDDSKYSLAIGETEAFDAKETVNALTLIPQIKRDFFNESPIGFILSPFGWGLIAVMYLVAGVVGLVYRLVLKKVAKNTPRGLGRNIGKFDRLIRLAIGIALLAWAVTTTWSPILIFFSGFAIFEAIFSWCGLYAAMGKSTCPNK